MSVSLLHVLAAAQRRAAPLTGECAGYLMLAAADQTLETPRKVRGGQICLEETGAVRIVGGDVCSAEIAETALRELLDALMLVARSGSAALMRIGRRPACGDIAQLVRELEVALIPANRAAARRSLARLYRETARAVQAAGGELAPPESEALLLPETQPLATSPRTVEPAPLDLDPIAESVAAKQLAEPTGILHHAAANAQPRGLPDAPVAAAPAQATSEARDSDKNADNDAIDIEFTPMPVAPAALSEAAPAVPHASMEQSVSHCETPAEPAVRRRASAPPSYVPDIPDIHKTPYLGTVIAPISDVLAQPGFRPSSLGRAGQPRVELRSEPMVGLDASPAQAAQAADFDEGDATDPMPAVEEWLDSDDLEERNDDFTPAAPSVGPLPEARPASGADSQAAIPQTALESGHEPCPQPLAIQPTLMVVIDDAQNTALSGYARSLSGTTDDDSISASADPPVVWASSVVEQGPIEPAPPRFAPPESSVRELLGQFQVQASAPNTELMRSLKELAGITVTPPPVRVFQVAVLDHANPEEQEHAAESEPSVRRVSG